jgi:hypothetical protein
MATHYWGEEGFDWHGISAAAAFIGEGMKKWKVDVRQYKEKFGEVRVYCSLGLQDLHQLTHPGYVSNQWPQWAWELQFIWPARLLVRFLNLFFLPLHKYLYRRYYEQAVTLWPHLHDEILDAADWPELLEGL